MEWDGESKDEGLSVITKVKMGKHCEGCFDELRTHGDVRCENCKSWDRDVRDWGNCNLIYVYISCVEKYEHGIRVREDFGCKFFESKDYNETKEISEEEQNEKDNEGERG
jgi:hypothetical protein